MPLHVHLLNRQPLTQQQQKELEKQQAEAEQAALAEKQAEFAAQISLEQVRRLANDYQDLIDQVKASHDPQFCLAACPEQLDNIFSEKELELLGIEPDYTTEKELEEARQDDDRSL